MISLSSSQQEIVEFDIKLPIQILASAGSGKTRVLTERIRYILNNTKKDKVLALTFTNKAAQEMQDRLANFVGVEERTWVSTIHSVAQSIIESYGHTIGLSCDLHIYERDQDRMELFLQSLRDSNIDIDEYLNINDPTEKRKRNQVMQGYMDAFAEIKRELLTERDEIEARFSNEPRFYDIYQDYQEALLNSGGIDFNDILFLAYKILNEHSKIARTYQVMYKHVCVDESQDLNKAQYELIKAFCGERVKSILMVGDPNQMIYGFNGSKDYFETDFLRDFQPNTFTLRENYRSSKEVIKLANVIKPNSQINHEAAFDGCAKIQPCINEEVEANWLIRGIKSLLSAKEHREIEGDISLEKMVVIGRNKFVFNKLKEKLDENNIIYHFNKGERQAEPDSLFGRVLDYAIRLKLNPKDWIDGKKLCTLLKIQQPEQWNDNNLLNTWSLLVESSDLPLAQAQSFLLREIDTLDIEQPNVRKFCTTLKNKLAEYESLDLTEKEQIELVISGQELNEFQKKWTTFKRRNLGTSLKSFRNAMTLGKLDSATQGRGLTLSTVHTMKGLEKDIVFLIGMCDGVFPDYRAMSKKDLDEEKNNAFVAVTRAKRWLYISYPQYRMMPWGQEKKHNISRFLNTLTSNQMINE
ncbi:ATP-dependent helicase [Photobacterium iliopiscarium]|uniref:ATP-dependent helicase n=1 Tax=Photobacterium iliopiscarium TaxID=56192 RepID=UPI000D15BECF|nr:ATP-dependent helicase [Photobacterium iliopiscarium]PST87268.1 ATP-dependent helicase [Photobacterium iliopiscarium]